MPKTSAGLMMYRLVDGRLQVLLVHPGGPFFQNKDLGAWTIPKGEPQSGEELLAAALREFQEETGFVPCAPFLALTAVRQRGGKIVHAWAFESDCEPADIKSNRFSLVWPPKSGRQMEFPEIDQAAFFQSNIAKQKINPAQVGLIEELEGLLRGKKFI